MIAAGGKTTTYAHFVTTISLFGYYSSSPHNSLVFAVYNTTLPFLNENSIFRGASYYAIISERSSASSSSSSSGLPPPLPLPLLPPASLHYPMCTAYLQTTRRSRPSAKSRGGSGSLRPPASGCSMQARRSKCRRRKCRKEKSVVGSRSVAWSPLSSILCATFIFI